MAEQGVMISSITKFWEPYVDKTKLPKREVTYKKQLGWKPLEFREDGSVKRVIRPMLIGRDYISSIIDIEKITKINVHLYGSLSLTGKGHLTDIGVVLGLSGYIPSETTTQEISEIVSSINTNQEIILNKIHKMPFTLEENIIFHKEFLPLHENGLTFETFFQNGTTQKQTYYSTGGGFFATAEKLKSNKNHKQEKTNSQYDFTLASELLAICAKENMTIAEVAMAKENKIHSKEYITKHFTAIWEVMQNSVKNGLSSNQEYLPGGLFLTRRAKTLHTNLLKKSYQKYQDNQDFLYVYAMAASEENAAGHQIVTAPTNGASGIMPAILCYYDKFYEKLDNERIVQALLTASAIGYIFKTNASISGAEAGCQAEIGVASAMGAATFVYFFGGNPKQMCIAAEIAMEHHLGLVCDPVQGLVQVPCIERNSFGAIKSLLAARMAMQREPNSKPIIHLDDVVKTMYAIGKDMHIKYKETSTGGLAIFAQTSKNKPNCS